MPQPGQRDPIKMQYWGNHIVAWRESALSKSQYCQSHGLKLNNFCSWEVKVRESDDAASSFRRSQRTKQKYGRNRKARSQRDSAETNWSAAHEQASFVQANIGPEPDSIRPLSSQDYIEISCPSGVLIKLPSATNTDTLLAVLAALAG